jgi:hypothetical protein
MADTTKDISRIYEAGVEPVYNDHALEATSTVYEGAVVTADPTANTVGAYADADVFVGFADTKCDNSAGAAGDRNVHVRSRGIVKLTVTDSAGTPLGTNIDLGDAIYSSDNQTFTNDATGTLKIGTVHRVVSTSAADAVCMVYFEAAGLRSV